MARYRTAQTDDRIRHLESELWEARYELVHLMPDDVATLLSDYHSCETRADYHRWENDVVEEVVSRATPDPEASSTYFGERSYCLLCKGGSQGPYEQGFKLPEGLRRHLVGYGNSRQCPVTKAAFANARASLHDSFFKSDQKAETEKEERRKREILYFVDPRVQPRLIEEGLWSREIRNSVQLTAAEARLASLGFETERADNVITYKLARGPYIVIADPRKPSGIDFCIYLQQNSRMRGRTQVAHFHLPDNWKHDLLSKFNVRLQEATTRLPRAPAPKLAGRST